MNDTIREFPAARFAGGLVLLALSFALSFVCTEILPCGGYFLAVSPFSGSGTLLRMTALFRALRPTAISLLALWLSAHTPWSAAVSGMVIIGRGICLGCAGALMRNGTVVSIGQHWISALLLYFSASVLMILLAACSYAASRYFCRACADGNRRLFRETAAAYLRLFLIFSGGVFLLGMTAVLLIHGSV